MGDLAGRAAKSEPPVPHAYSAYRAEREALRRAIAWLPERGKWTPPLIEQACQRYDLAPAAEEFLLREVRRWQKHGEA